MRANAASASGTVFGPPVRAQPIPVPFLRQIPTLRQAQRSATRTAPLFAPAIDVLFRPEQEHGFSGKDYVLVPVTRGDGDVNDSF
jgi:hypothetical protein